MAHCRAYEEQVAGLLSAKVEHLRHLEAGWAVEYVHEKMELNACTAEWTELNAQIVTEKARWETFTAEELDTLELALKVKAHRKVDFVRKDLRAKRRKAEEGREAAIDAKLVHKKALLQLDVIRDEVRCSSHQRLP